MQEWLIQFSAHHTIWVYVAIVILACAEGPFISILLGALVKFHYFSLIPVYIALMVGDLVGDSIWYWVGRHFGLRFIRRFGNYFSINECAVTRVTGIFNKYSTRILIISKISNGFGFSLGTLVTAGIAKVPFIRYMVINAIGQFFWTGLLVGIGYFIGNLYTQANTVIEYVSVTAIAIVLMAAMIGYRKYLKGRTEKMN